MSTADDGSFTFRNRFTIKNKTLGIATDRYLLTPPEAAQKVFIAAGSEDTTIEKCSDLVLVGVKFPTFEAALNAGRMWRQILISTMPHLGIASELGDDEDQNLIVPEPRPKQLNAMLGLDPGIDLREDRIGLFVYSTGRRIPRFVYGTASAQVLSKVSTLSKLIGAAQERYAGAWSAELRLAYGLVNAGLSELNPEAKFILLVTAIEALIPYREKDRQLSDLLDSLKPAAQGNTNFDEDTRVTAVQLLESAKMNSIRQYGLKLAERLSGEYDGLTPKKYFDAAYATRSALAHGNLRDVPHLSENALRKRQFELSRFVLDILETWTPDLSGDAGPRSAEDETVEP